MPTALDCGVRLPAPAGLQPVPGQPGDVKGTSSEGALMKHIGASRSPRLYEPFTSSFKSIVKSQPNYSKLSIFIRTGKPCSFTPHHTALWGQLDYQLERVTTWS